MKAMSSCDVGAQTMIDSELIRKCTLPFRFHLREVHAATHATCVRAENLTSRGALIRYGARCQLCSIDVKGSRISLGRHLSWPRSNNLLDLYSHFTILKTLMNLYIAYNHILE